MVTDRDDVLREFLAECHEGLDQLDKDLVALERLPEDGDLIARIFRSIHTIKGTSGFFGFTRLESLTHAGESLLALVRSGARRMTPDRATGLLGLVDAVREIVGRIESTGDEGTDTYDHLVGRLAALETDGPPQNLGDLLIARGLVEPEDVAAAAVEQARGDPRRIGEILVERAGVPPHAIVDALEAQGHAGLGTATGRTSVRLDVGLLDRLVNLVEDLALVRNEILAAEVALTPGPFAALCGRLDRITARLQQDVVKTRLQPIGIVWSRLPRVVRDLSLACRKQVRVELFGNDVEVDRSVIEAIKDPFTHLVRNAVDHGIEPPETRAARGKPAEGRLVMRALKDGGHVMIEVIDDGAGIDVERIKAKAVEQGVLTVEQARCLSHLDAARLVFRPGLTTAANVTTRSGRGVGMDVVRTNVERIGGTVDVDSRPGAGTAIRIRLPRTPAGVA